MDKSKKGIVALGVALLLVSTVLAVALYQISLNNTMRLSADYTIKLYEHETTTPITVIAWGNFSKEQKKTYVIDMQYAGNTMGKIWWENTCPSSWSVALRSKTPEATSYTTWLSDESNALMGLNSGQLMYVEISLTEISANPEQAYSFQLTFSSAKYP